LSEISNTERTAAHGDHGPAPYPTGDPGRDPRKRTAYARYVDALWDEQTEDLRNLHLTWEQNLLFLANQHWHRLGPGGFRVDRNLEDWQHRPVYNFCLPFYNTYLSKATKSRPATQTIPASSDPQDMKAAELADEILDAKWTELKGQRRFRLWAAWTISTGNGYALPFWNARSGKLKRLEVEVEVPIYATPGLPLLREDPDRPGMEVPATEVVLCPCDEDGMPLLGRDGRPKPGAEAHVIDQGEIDFRIYSPFQVRVNAEATCDEDVTSFTVVEPMSLRQIEERWPEHAHLVREEDVSQLMGTHSTLAAILDGKATGQHGGSPKDERAKKLSRALVKHYYEKQCPKYPDGRYWTCAGDVLLDDPQPLPDGLFKLIHMQDVLIPGRYHGMSRLEAVVSINREYNELSARIAEHHELHSNPKIGAPRQAGIKKGTWTRKPGEFVEYTYPYKPEPIQVPQLPASVFQERERLLADFERISGMRAVSQGGTTGGVTAGIAIMQLQEADDADMGPLLASGEECVAELSGALLVLIKGNYTDERLYYAAGPNRRYMVKSFQASDLEGAVDVVPSAGGTRTGSEVARQAVMMEIANTRPEVFNDPETDQFDVASFARALQLGGLEPFYESQDVHRSEAMREEEAFSLMGGVEEMEIPKPEPWQDHRIHFNQHRRVLASAEWKQWPKEAQDAFLAHFMATRDAMEGEMVRRQMLMAPPAAPGEGGAPGEAGMNGMEMGMDPLGSEADMLEQEMEMASGAGMMM
jgi:hypothetical protein